ncbi:MAG: stage 0 sporulation family protein [Armatimonadetes bacterium]|nr:stage 0 sporulation family protein [Armatimonadota bacterium]
MARVVGISFHRVGKVYFFSPGDLSLSIGDCVIVETSKGMDHGVVAVSSKEVRDEEIAVPLRNVVRIADNEDVQKILRTGSEEKRAGETCRRKIRKHQLPMKLVGVEHAFDGSKIIFYFTAEGRVDFRALVKDLAGVFKTRIELHQIGVRDEAKLVGGLGPCGRSVCCATFLREFGSVNIRMAKEQSLSLNPQKLSGLCGRLKCCLRYEVDAYQELKRSLPPLGSEVAVPGGNGRVVEWNIPKRTVVVELPTEARIKLPANEVRLISLPPQKGKKREEHVPAEIAELE